MMQSAPRCDACGQIHFRGTARIAVLRDGGGRWERDLCVPCQLKVWDFLDELTERDRLLSVRRQG